MKHNKRVEIECYFCVILPHVVVGDVWVVWLDCLLVLVVPWNWESSGCHMDLVVGKTALRSALGKTSSWKIMRFEREL